MLNIIMFLVSWKLEEQLATTAHTLEWPESKTLTTPNADENVEQWELSVTAGRRVWQFLTKLNILFP